VGYARVSTDAQNHEPQLDALDDAGCECVYRDVGSGSLRRRPQLDVCLDYLRAGDTLVVWRLDRLGRGMRHLIDAIEQLHAREIGFSSLTEAIDTTSSAAMLQFHIFAALAEFERQVIRERTRLGLAGRPGPRPAGWSPGASHSREARLARMMREQKRTMPEIARALGVSRATLYRHLTLDG
jgi:DNA invertase Pin-like site-specific DNA recombinase